MDDSTTFEMFMKLRTLCDRVGAVVTTNYFGENRNHMVRISHKVHGRGKTFSFKQTGDSLNYCLKSIYSRAEEKINELIASGELQEIERTDEIEINYNKF